MRLQVRDADTLCQRARERTGLHEFGGEEFRPWLELLVESVNADVALHEAGVHAVEETVVRSLANRLQIEDWYHTNPAVAATPVDGPTLVVGLPRSGTTALVGMLAQDPSFRALRSWEAAEPCPPPERGREDDDPRVHAAREFAEQIPPELAAMHIVDPLGPEEDHDLLNLGFCAGHYGGFWPVYRYPAAWLGADMADAFAQHERALRLLGSRRPPTEWLLKQPLHVFQLDAFAARYPGARFVMTHRDPARSVPSVCSLMAWSYRAVTDHVDLARHGAWQVEFWAEGMRRSMAARDRLGEHRFVDVFHDELVRDPVGEIQRIYDVLGRDLGPSKGAVGRYVEAHRGDASGLHHYTAEEFGLRADAIRAEFADYVERFDLGHG